MELKFNIELLKQFTPNELVMLLLLSQKINPNDYFKNNIECVITKNTLQNKKLIKIGENHIAYIRAEGLNVLSGVDEIEIFADKYRSLFKGTKVGAMGDKNLLITNLKRFKVMYPQFSDDTILKAVENYVTREANNNNYKYLQKAHFTVFKEGKSRLYELCEDYVNNPYTYNKSNFFTDL